MNFSKNNYAFTVQQSLPATKEIISNNTFYKWPIARVVTTKYFIGQVNDTDFKIIGSSAKSPACSLSGKMSRIDATTTLVEVETKIPQAYMILLIMWTLVMAVFTLGRPIMSGDTKHLFAGAVGLVAGAVVFRLVIHLFYVVARNKSIRSLESIIQ